MSWRVKGRRAITYLKLTQFSLRSSILHPLSLCLPLFYQNKIYHFIILFVSSNCIFLMALPFEALVLKRNGRGYLIEEYMFIKAREARGTLHLRCQEYKTSNCTATAKITDETATIVNPVHSHTVPDIESIRFRSAVMDKARDLRLITLKVLHIVFQIRLCNGELVFSCAMFVCLLRLGPMSLWMQG